MNILIWFLTAVLVLDCLLLILLVLIQLPKKEAGLGQAFGASATDALFGAGSGNVLTKLTKYTSVTFFVVTLLISMLQGHQARAKTGDPRLKLSTEDKLAGIAAAAKPAAPTNATTATNLINLKLTNGLTAPTNGASPAK
jgi:preprotein translocase subunit SecG